MVRQFRTGIEGTVPDRHGIEKSGEAVKDRNRQNREGLTRSRKIGRGSQDLDCMGPARKRSDAKGWATKKSERQF
jgi:hypothetical protein